MAASPKIKTCLLGGGGQGKSALVMKFITGEFLADYDPTIEDTYSKNVTTNGQSALMEILDTAGQEVFWSMQEQWIRDSQIYILVFSICSLDGFKTCDLLRNKVLQVKETENAPFILVGTHSDADAERVVSKDQAQQKATKWDCDYIEVSSLSSENLQQLFEMVLPLYFQSFGGGGHKQQRSVPETIEYQSKSACSCLCGDDDDDGLDDFVYDELYTKLHKNSTKIQFFKTEELPPDHIPSPILSLKNFRIARTFSWIRFLKVAVCGIFLPCVILFQTFVFLTYSERKATSVYPYSDKEYNYDSKASLLLDYLGMVVGRKPGQDPEAIKDRQWFLRQTKAQKWKRVILSIFVCVIFVICCYNISRVGVQKGKVSLSETVGPFLLFVIVWGLLSVWIGYDQQLRPSLPAPARLRSLTIFFGEEFSHRSSVYKFVRAFESSRTNNRWKLNKIRTFLVIFLGAFYACVPGFTRLTFGDSSEFQKGGKEGHFFSTDGDIVLEVCAMFVNFVLVSSIIYCVEIQYKKQFDNYRTWMSDITQTLHKKEAKRDAFRGSVDQRMVELPSKGSAISKDLFISMTRRQNALGWLEIRSFLAVQGQVLFGEQELPTTWFIAIACLLTFFTFYRVFFIAGNALESILFNAMAILTVICLIALIRMLITAYQFDALQMAQEKLLTEQKFYMRCNRPYDEGMLDSHAIGDLERNRSQQSKSKLLSANPLSEVPTYEDGKEEQKETETSAEIEIEMTENEIEPLPKQNTVPLKYDSYHSADDTETQPLLSESEALTVVKSKVTRMDAVNRYSHKVAFVEDLLVLVRKQDIYPRLFKLRLHSLLSKIVTVCIICAFTTAVKVYVNKDT